MNSFEIQDALVRLGFTVVKDNARVSYEYRFRRDGEERRLDAAEQAFVTRVLGRGQIPYLQVQASPVSSPRVDQDVAFSMLCSSTYPTLAVRSRRWPACSAPAA